MPDVHITNVNNSDTGSEELNPFWRSSSEVPRGTPLSDSPALFLEDLEHLPEEKIYKRTHSGRSTSFKSIIEYKLIEALLGEQVHTPEGQARQHSAAAAAAPDQQTESHMNSVLGLYHGELRKQLGEKVAEVLNEPDGDSDEEELDAGEIGGMFLNELDKTLNKVLQNAGRSRPASSRPESRVMQARDAIVQALKEVLSEQSMTSRGTSAKSRLDANTLNPEDLQRAKTRLASSRALYDLLDDLMEQMRNKVSSRPESSASLASTVIEFGEDPSVSGRPPQSARVTINSRARMMNKARRPRGIKSAPASILKKRVSCDTVCC